RLRHLLPACGEKEKTSRPLVGRRKRQAARLWGEGKDKPPACGEKKKTSPPACGEKEKTGSPACGARKTSPLVAPVRAARPAAILARVLFLQPRVQRREIFEDRARVHLALAGQFLQGLLPRLARAFAEHLPEFRAGFLVAVDRAGVERALVAGRLAQLTIE